MLFAFPSPFQRLIHAEAGRLLAGRELRKGLEELADRRAMRCSFHYHVDRACDPHSALAVVTITADVGVPVTAPIAALCHCRRPSARPPRRLPVTLHRGTGASHAPFGGGVPARAARSRSMLPRGFRGRNCQTCQLADVLPRVLVPLLAAHFLPYDRPRHP